MENAELLLLNDTNDDNASTVHLSINLEHFPIEILLRIFTVIDDIGLLNLSIISYRFKSIAALLFGERYADRYFIIDSETELQRKIYAQQFDYFGCSIHAIKAIDINGIDNMHWMASLIKNYLTNHLARLYFCNCTFKNGCIMLTNHMNITHLTIIGGHSDQAWIHLPKYHHLKKLELRTFHRVTDVSLDYVIRHNPQLESLILHHASVDFSFPKIMAYVHKYLKHLKEFIVLNDHCIGRDHPIDERRIDRFLSVTSNLTSLGLTMQTQYLDLYQRLSRNCKQNVKFLELHCIFKQFSFIEMNQMMDVARSFENVETLSLDMNYSYHDTSPILSLLENLSHLRTLYIPQMDIDVIEFILALLRTCEHLERLVILIKDEFMRGPAFSHHINAHFHQAFLNVKRNANVEIEFSENGRTIGHVSEKEIIWRNKMVHWIGYNSIYDDRKLNLLELSEHNTANGVQEARNPFDLMIEYLDLNSLYALHECSTKCKRLIEKYVQQRPKRDDRFVLSDEFIINYNGLRYFAPYVTNLTVELINRNASNDVRDLLRVHYKNLKKLTVYTHHQIPPHEFILPCVEQYIFCSHNDQTIYHLNLIDFLTEFKQLKIVELKCSVKFIKRDTISPTNSFPNLKLFKFKSNDENEAKFATDLFTESETKVIVLD